MRKYKCEKPYLTLNPEQAMLLAQPTDGQNMEESWGFNVKYGCIPLVINGKNAMIEVRIDYEFVEDEG